MKQRITISNLRCQTIIGIYESERHQRQPVILHCALDIDASALLQSGDISDTLDYHQFTKALQEYVEQGEFALLEELLADLFAFCRRYPHILAAELTIEKPEALKAFGAGVQISGRWEQA